MTTKPITIDAQVVEKKQLTADVFELYLKPSTAFTFKPGQFISIIIPGRGPGGRDLRRAYSISSKPEQSLFELCIKLVEGGPGTNYLNDLKVGESLRGTVPFGDFVFKTTPDRHAVMIATGTGIAPFRSMVFSGDFAASTPLSTTVLFGARESSDFLYTDEFTAKLGAGRFIQTVSRPQGSWNGFKGRVTDWLRANQREIDFAKTDFYLCGNGAMIDEVKSILAAHGLGKESVFQEAYYKPKAGEVHASQG